MGMPMSRDSFAVVILSANAGNAVASVRSILRQEPMLDPRRIIIVDDGARALAEPQLPGIRWIEGEKPFVFARNANIGLRAAGKSDVILMNDDVELLTPGGFTRLAGILEDRPDIGLASASVEGRVGNPLQRARPGEALRIETVGTICFVCVYLPRRVIDEVGILDERFVGYGCEDTDFTFRVRAAGLNTAVFDGCVVDHSHLLPPTFSARPDFLALVDLNEEILLAKMEKRRPAG
jgi:GT2 family glycosyltransferase